MTGSSELVLGIDIGKSALKALAIDANGRVRAQASAAYETQTPQPGWSEQRPDDWWQACRASILALGTQVPLTTLASIELRGSVQGTVFLDGDGEPIRNAILANDERATAECEEIERTVGVERLVEITGRRASAGSTAATLLWLRRNQPISYKRLHHVLLPKDYVRLMLTGEFATDVGDASDTGLFDVGARAWSTEIIDALNLDEAILPRTYEGPELNGRLLPHVAADLGLPAGIPVSAGGGPFPVGADDTPSG